MGIHFKFLSYDRLFENTTDRKIVVNDVKFNDSDFIMDILYSVREDEIDFVPTCECGKTKGFLYDTCTYCGSKVVNIFDITNPIIWIRKLDNNLPFLNITFYTMLKDILKHSKRGKTKKYDYVRWLCDTSYRVSDVPLYLKNIEVILGERTYHNFISKLDKILIFLSNHQSIKLSKSKSKTLSKLIKAYSEDRDKLLSNYIPLINKRLLVMNITSSKYKYTLPILSNVINIVRTPLSLDKSLMSEQRYNSLAGKYTVRILSELSNLFEEYNDSKLSGKKKLVRKHIFGTRSHFTFRTVVTTLSTGYDYDEIHVPYVIGLVVFRPHLINKLLSNTNLSYRDINKLLIDSILKPNKLVTKYLNELIQDSKFKTVSGKKGIPTIVNRNPTLLQGSSQLVYITKFKDDPYDKTAGVNIMVFRAMNADTDGDQLNFIPLLDNQMVEGFKDNPGEEGANLLSPHRNIIDLDISKVNGYLYLNPNTAVSITNFLVNNVSINTDNDDDIVNVLKG